MPGLQPQTIGGVPGSSPSQYALIPRGLIVMWSGRLAQLPSGWALCDGTNGTPNLVARFVRGINTSRTDPGTLGGSDTHLHAHTATHSHEVPWQIPAGVAARSTASLGTGGSAAGIQEPTNNSGVTTSAARQKTNAVAPGSTDSADGRPAFYELAFIIKL
ncbi:MAG: hypothetical protein K8T20_11835 [Planctomycetes bacterium]|nr:hypothetical protein [Planctomycetota bacterium]